MTTDLHIEQETIPNININQRKVIINYSSFCSVFSTLSVFIVLA